MMTRNGYKDLWNHASTKLRNGDSLRREKVKCVQESLLVRRERTFSPSGANSQYVGDVLRFLRCAVCVLLLMMGVNVWGQTDHSGVYYIKHNADNLYYLCTSTVFYDGNHYANSGDMPYLTTAKEATIADWENEAVWRIIKAESGNYYYVVHAVDGKYLTYNDDPTNFTNNNNEGNRLSLHLQYLKDEEKSLFIITKSGNWYNITPKTKSTWSLNPAGNNYDTRAGHSDKKQNIAGAGNNLNVGGLIGLWLNANDKSKWQFEAITDKPICEAPTFTNNGSLSISCSTTGANIYYTTDGSTIPTTSSYNGSSQTVTEDINVIWARATTQNSEPYYWSPLSVYVIPQCATPVISIINGKLNLSCATEGATIYYTINGTDPTTEYDPNNKPDVTENDIIKAVATKNGYHKSKVASVTPSLTVHNTSEINNMLASYILASDFTISSSIGTEAEPFRGVIDGGLHTFSNFNKALVAYANGATIKNVILDNVTIGENANGYAGAICSEALGDTRIYNCGVKSGTISGTNAGSIVGKLDGNSRVINCYSFATVSGGTWGAGIVGYNSFSSTRSDLRTMVMNCMFYGEISSNTNLSPIYGGEKITNVSNLNGYNYYRFDANYSQDNAITDYNCALAAEEKYLTRFEFFRNTLNSNRELAAWYATGDPSEGKGIGNACKMAKWVLDPADKPYPILKAQDYYPSFINYEDAPNLGTIDLTINESNTTTGGEDKPNGASINSNYPTTLTVYDKDLTHKHFNYRTVRLPYYNEVGTGNCTHNKVVTGWKITGFSGGTQGHFVKNVIDYSGTTHDEDEYPPYNFADRYCTDKDKYAVSGRVFSQGAYYDVPEGVTGITIEPYWGAAVYLSDPTYDVAYPEGYGDKNVNAVFVSNMGSRYVGGNTASINDDNQTVYTDYDSAFGQVGSSGTVYDNAIVLVGNYHHYWGQNSPSTTKAFTIMSADLNNDCEPDYSFLVQHGTNRQDISAIRFDFINSPGLGMIQKVETDKAIPKHGIWYPKGWFEVTNTTLIQFTQFEYDKGGKPAGSPLILLGGIYDQFVTSRYNTANSTEYIHLGSNIWMKEFCNGTHTANANTSTTRHIPISVTGGEFESFYLTGTFQPNVTSVTDNAECYINGGKFVDMAGAGQEQLKGDVTWLIDHADITNFYGGGINGQKPVTGNIYVEINNSQVGLYCGGPKFGNMQADKKVTTKAKGSTFGSFYGAGYGGTSYFRHMTKDKTGEKDWDTWVGDYTRKYVDGKGISTEYEYEFIPYSGGQSGQANYVGRFYVLYASLSLAETKNVESTLEDCHITGSFYGGGKLGRVDGNITSTLKDCTVGANVYGAGFSASVEKVNVVPKGAKMNPNPGYNESVGVFTDGTYPDGEEYTWTYAASVSEGNEFDDTNHLIYTTTDLTDLGIVTGNATLNIEGTTTVGGSVYGGGEESAINGNTEVNINGGTIGTDDSRTDYGNVFGGGNLATVGGSVTVNMSAGTVENDVYGGGALANTNIGNATNYGQATESITSTTTNTTTVRLTGGTIKGDVYGGGLGDANSPAYVYGDVLVDLNGTTTMNNTTGKPTSNGAITTNTKGCAVNQVFGGNNVNGSPKGDIMVHVYATQNANATQIANTAAVEASGDDPAVPAVENAKVKGRYDVKAVYGGGNQAAYVPASPYTTSNTSGGKTQVIIEGCEYTSIETVYGGGNAAAVPETNVEIREAYEIQYVFGGGNGYSATNNHTNPSEANYNPGADVGVYNSANYGTGYANAILKGGYIHEAYGGSNQKGNIKGKININTDPQGNCSLNVEKLVGAGKNADVDGDLIMILGCKPTTKTPLIFAGADNADVNGNVELTITSGTFGQVFGGNNLGGAIKGHIVLNIEETGCNPICIDELYLGGNEAAYSIYGYYEDSSDNNKVKPRTSAMHAITDPSATGYVAPLTNPSNTDNKHPFPYAQPVLNVISATSIGKVFGGGLGEGAVMHADPIVNINMIKGTATGSLTTLGAIGDVYGGGNAAAVSGNTTVNIGTETTVQLHELINADGTYQMSDAQTVEGAHITGNVFGGGNKADVTGNTYVNICTKMTPQYDTNNNFIGYSYSAVTHSGTDFEGISIGASVFGGGSEADVKGNTHVQMSDGYVFNGIFGGGLSGSVGTFTTSTNADDISELFNHVSHDDCTGKPVSCADGTGKCTVVVNGGQIGPIEVATEGMRRLDTGGGPVPQGWVWGGSCGIVADPSVDPDSQFKAYVNETDVTIGGTAFILESIIGGGEFGRVLGNTKVTIQDHCQIGVGDGKAEDGKPIRYTDGSGGVNGTTNQFVDPTTTTITTANALATCSHFPFGMEKSGKMVYDCYDPYADGYKTAHNGSELYPGGVTDNASDGKTWIGCVFGGGSGYMPYVNRNNSDQITDYDWVRSAGLVEGNSEVIITGGHILTNVYGGNEYTDVLGKSTVKMSGGTVGVPRTKEQIEALPMCGYIFGAGKGDERTHFNTATNVGSAEVEVSGGIVYGSVYGGGEDGHVLGDVTVTIKEAAKIGTCGTSYFDGNVFGGGRGFSGIAQTAGTVGGNITLNIEGGKMLGSVYGGGRLASVGTMFEFPTLTNGDPNPSYGNFKEDEGGNTYGYVTVNISGGEIGRDFSTLTTLPAGAEHSGNVFGGSMGRLDLLNGTRNSIWPKMAQVKKATINISGNNTLIRRSVYGGGELGTVRDDAIVTISGGTIRRDVYGGGYGSEDRTYTVFSVYEPNSTNTGYNNNTYAFTPMQFAGCVGKSTTVNVSGGYIRKSIYGGGEMASVGIIDCMVEEVASEPGKDKIIVAQGSGKWTIYKNMIKHWDVDSEFALSWPYEFNYVPGYNGDTHVNITGGRLGLKGDDNDEALTDNGDVYGAGKGKAGDYKDYVFCANVGSTDVKIEYPSTPEAYTGTVDCIAGAVYGGGEDGHVMGNTKLTLKEGLIYHSIYGGGSGKGTFSTSLLKIGSTSDYYTRDIYSIMAGKVFGNTEVNMTGGYVVRNVYGGGNMGSVGKGNYAGGTDDYSYYVANDKTYNGYGEALNGNLWSGSGKFTTAFLNSGKCTVKISGGTIGYIDTTTPSNSMYPYNSSASLPYGNVFGGCRGESAPNITESPRYLYSPEFFVGYANETEVTIEGANTKILGSVYGGGMDGHIRRDAHVIIKGGEIGIPFDATNKSNVQTEDPDDIQWLARGNVYGAGSGIGKYKYDFDYDGAYTTTNFNYNGKETKEEDFSTSAGSVTRFTKVEIQGGTIHRNVYGGGSLSSIGAPRIPTSRTDNPVRRDDSATGTKGKQSLNEVVISGGQIGGDYSYSAGNHVYGGHVFGGSRGDATLNTNMFSTSMFSSVTINANNSPIIEGGVFGGGEVGIVKGSVDVTINGGTINDDVYGGGALANTNTENSSNNTYTTTVNLNGGRIKGDAYGGGLGQLGVTAVTGVHWTQEEITAAQEGDPAYNQTTDGWKVEPVIGVEERKAMVYGDVFVNLGKEDRTAATAFDVEKYTEGVHAGIVKSGRVFGCNNLNGSPQGNVTVTVNRTVKGNTEKTASGDLKSSDATKHSYHVAAVYGGGNLAGKTAAGVTRVVINGCDVSIRDVYGGGNAAEVPATDVLVNGAYEIEHVFGGGNGKDDYTLDGGAKWTTNPGANINGNTNTLLLGGLIHEAYGGSNEKGTISGSVSINTGGGDDQPAACSACPLDVEKLVGAGKNADVNGDLIMVLGCKPETKTPLVFGGADNANVNGNVELTITSGTFGQVFGGNNLGGVIRGHIILNIEETGCNPIKIDELYLGGNQAAYSRYGYYNAGTAAAPDIQPRTAEMHAITNTADPNYKAPVGNPTVDATHPFPYAQPVLNVISCTSIGKVFGGGLGTGAIMHADPTVNINMTPGAFANNPEKGVPAVMTAMNLSSDDNPDKLGIIGDVYGGGNAADVVGNPTVNIGTAAKVRNHMSYTAASGYVMSGEKDVKGAYINGNVFGGGMGKADEFTCAKAMVGEVNKGIDTDNNPLPGGTSVVIAKGTVNGNVYGGGEIGRVERNTRVTIGVEGDETSEPIIKGNVFGAGKGLETHGYSALVRGNAEVTIQGKAQVWQNVHGGGEKASVGRYNVRLSGDTDHPEVKVGMPYSLKAGGKCTVIIQDGATIGKEANTGNIYGAGQGVEPAYDNTPGNANRSKRMVTKTSDHNDENTDSWDYYDDDHNYVWEYFATLDDYLQYMETLARASETDVTIDGNAKIKGTVYGGSESGFVYYGTKVKIQKGTIDGDVFGGGKGLASFSEAGRVKRNTELTISDGMVKGNVYGGGSMGDVGTIDKSDQTNYNYKWKQNDGNTANTAENNKITGENANTGICHVTISGGTIGTGVAMSDDGTFANGNVYGAGKGLDDTWWCEKAMVFATNVNISAGTVRGTVYGGGEVGRVEDDAKVTIGVPNQTGATNAPIITGNVFGAGAGLATHGYSALVRGNSDVTVQGTAQIGGSVYGGGEIASVGRFHVVGGLPTKPESGGYCTVTIQDHAKIGLSGTEHNVFGACKGVTPAYNPNSYKDVYSVQTVANTPAGNENDTWDYYDAAHKFIKRYYKTESEYLAFLKTLALTSHPHVTIAEDAEVHGSVYGGGQRGVTLGHVDVDITGGDISQDVYGGGALADTNLGNWDENVYVVATSLNPGELITDLYTRTNTGTDQEPVYKYTRITDSNATISNDTYRRVPTWAHQEKSAYYMTKVNLLGGTIGGDAYGGGLGQLEEKTGGTIIKPAIEAKVYGDVYMNLNGFDKNEVTYDANIHGATGDGARLEVVDDEYLVKDAVKGAVVKQIFGCNNLNGSPQGQVKVHVFKTQRAGQNRITNTSELITAKVKVEPVNGEYDFTAFDVQAVYGGGNMAAYVPRDLMIGKTQVVIDGCDRTSIGQVYGGGNAASTPATEITVNGSYEVAEVFGGGNGKDKITINGVLKDNPGANVGFYDYSSEEDIYNTKEKRTTDAEFISKYVYGSGKANVNIYGGTIHRVFGGSNTKGNVRQSAITMLEDAEGCEFCVDEAYGGGKSAPMDAEAKLLMSCIPGLKEVYGGAEAADVYDDVTVTITNGTFDRVFGGNNLSGTIRGKITVNVEETGCRPVVIGELYGGGNQAGYSIYGYNSNGSLIESGTTPLYADPQVNVRSFTSIGAIYGGGYGAGATMVGNPTVNINESVGTPGSYPTTDDFDTDGFKEKVITVDGHEVILPSHTRGQIGAINNVFGGGNAAKVIGSTNVNIGTEATQTFVSLDDDPATTDVNEKVRAVVGADIRGNVYGGGNNAVVTGNTNVVVGKATSAE